MAATALKTARLKEFHDRLKEFQKSLATDPEGVDMAAFHQLVLDMRANGEKVKTILVGIPKKSAMGQRLDVRYAGYSLRFPELPAIQWGPKETVEDRELDAKLKDLNAATMAATRNNPFAAALAALNVSV